MNKMYQRLKESTLTPEEASARRIEMIKAGYNPYNQEDIIKFDELKASGAKIETQQERWKRQDQESQTALKDTAEKARQDFYSSEQGKKNEEVIKQSQSAVAQSTQRNADLLNRLNQYRERSRQEAERLAAKRAETQRLKQDLAAKTKKQVQDIESGVVAPGSSEWDSIVQGAIDSTKGIKPARAKVEADKLNQAKAEAEAAYGYKNPFLEEDVKSSIKEAIIHNFMVEAKFAPRGAGKQRPKSWSKGTKSGSEKRKEREEGKRQSDPREMYESKGGQNVFRPEPGGVGAAMDKSLADAVNVFSGEGVSIPKTITPRVAQILRDELAWRQKMDQYITRGQSGVGNVAPGSMVGEPIKENQLYYTKLKEAAQSWGPEVAGAAQDDATAQAYAEGQPRDPYHRVSADEREEMAKTLASDYGTEKIRAGLLGKISSLAGSAHKTSSKQDDLAAMERIQHLIGYGNAIIDAKNKPSPSIEGMPF